MKNQPKYPPEALWYQRIVSGVDFGVWEYCGSHIRWDGKDYMDTTLSPHDYKPLTPAARTFQRYLEKARNSSEYNEEGSYTALRRLQSRPRRCSKCGR